MARKLMMPDDAPSVHSCRADTTTHIVTLQLAKISLSCNFTACNEVPHSVLPFHSTIGFCWAPCSASLHGTRPVDLATDGIGNVC